MQIRQHKGGLDESIATILEIPATLVAVRAWAITFSGIEFDADELASITVRLYDENPDLRIPGWEKTYMIKYLPTGATQMGVLGMCNERVSDLEAVLDKIKRNSQSMAGGGVWPSINDVLTSTVRTQSMGRLGRVPGESTPIEERKARNSCISGHRPGEEKTCLWCQRARFYTLMTSYHGDQPKAAKVYTSVTCDFHSEEDKAFIFDWLKLPIDASRGAIIQRLQLANKIDTLRSLGGGGKMYIIEHPISREMVSLPNVSSIMLSTIANNPDIMDIYKSAMVMLFETPIDSEYIRSIGVSVSDGGDNFKHMRDMMSFVERTQRSVDIISPPSIAYDIETGGHDVTIIDSLSIVEAEAPVFRTPNRFDSAWMERNATIGARPSISRNPAVFDIATRLAMGAAVGVRAVDPLYNVGPVVAVGGTHGKPPQNRAERRSKKPKQHGAVHSVNKVEVKTSSLLKKLVGKKKG